MKILQVITSLQIGGAERLVIQMAIAMTEMGHTVDVCVFNGEETMFTKELHEKGIKVIGFGTSVYNPLYVLKLAKLMRNYDLVHTHNSSPQLFVAIGGLFREVTRNSVELTITERIWGMIINIINEIAQCFEIEDEKIFETLINRSDKLQHFIQIYELKMAS